MYQFGVLFRERPVKRYSDVISQRALQLGTEMRLEKSKTAINCMILGDGIKLGCVASSYHTRKKHIAKCYASTEMLMSSESFVCVLLSKLAVSFEIQLT